MRVRVDWRASGSLVGTVVKWLAVPMVFPLALAAYYGNGLGVFLVAIAIAVVVGWLLERLDDDPDIGAREGFLMVALSWLAVSVVGAVPYLVEAHGVPGMVAATSPSSTLGNPVNALFESMSGFTTTGATVMGHISFEYHSRALLMWRQQTQWLGGMGIVVLAIAILPQLSVGGAQLMDAEAPGPGIEKLTPRIAETARALWGLYVGLTALEVCLLYAAHLGGVAPNMDVYNAVAHGFTTMPTGGFSPAAQSIGAFSAVVQWIIVPFMLFAGTNFALFWHLWHRDLATVREDVELEAYLGIVAVLTALVAGMLYTTPGLERLTGALEPAVRHAVFQMASIVTTTGYASMDFNQWDQHAKFVVLFAMFVGGSAGSTGGGIKVVRWVVIAKSLRRELFTTVHPDAVEPIRLAGRVVDERAVRGIYAFTLLYLVLFAVGVLVVVVVGLPGARLSAFEATSAVAATIGNVGPGIGVVGPMENYLSFPAPTKLLFVLLMWVGRLEIIPVLVLLTPAYWRT